MSDITSSSPLGIFLDSCVWDFLFHRDLSLERELPKSDFALFITRQAEFEISLIPEAKPLLREYVRHSISVCPIRTRSYFGFYNPAHPENEQRAGGFGFGEMISYQEIPLMQELEKKWQRETIRPTKLYKNEADIALAVRSLGNVVLTADKKAGPLADAIKRGGKVLYLNDFDKTGKTLAEYVIEYHNSFRTGQPHYQ